MQASDPSSSNHEPTPAWVWRVLAVVTVLGAFLRFFELGKESFWLDEFFSRDVAIKDFHGMVEKLSSGFDLHPPASHFLLHFSIRVFGDNEWALRLPTAVFGTLTIPMAFIVGRRFYSYREGLTAAALAAVLWLPVDISRNARPYAMLIFASGLSAWFFWRLLVRLRQENVWSWKDALGYAAAALLACYSHYFGGLLVAFQAAYALLACRAHGRRLLLWLGLYVMISVGYAPWLPIFLSQLSNRHAYGVWIHGPVFMDLPAFVFFLFNLSELIGCAVLAAFAMLTIAGIHEFLGRRRAGERPDLLESPGVFLAVWFAGPVLLTFVLSLVMQPMFVYRYLTISTLPAYILFARAIFKIPVSQPARGWVAGVVSALFLIHLLIGLKYLVRPWHAQFREASEYVAKREPGPDGVVLGYVWGADGRYYDYYFERAGSPLRVRFGNGERDIPELSAYLEKSPPKRLWFIITNHAPEPELVDCLKARMAIKERIRFYEAEVWLYVPRTPG